ncbi:hypothetical protein PRIPAC_70873 [Pristionchus pacificus]|uniref:Uncharacterized protein n=1 Tax=Pristionchus pacificus TaxID=54126 RepID=A0A2A6C797_PRIPA|nr:hypothetical protein PRIPAC_70873 [Pristionchus pacificus]|eukprot:PDM73938.1 hypothetical protein PRIPAC_41294 [Pristionchus pacificus]
MYVFKFEGTLSEAPANTSLIPKLRDDLLARILSIFFAVWGICDFLHIVYSWSWFEVRIYYAVIMVLEVVVCCFLASGCVKGRNCHIAVAGICELILVIYYASWFVLCFLSFLGFDFATSLGYGYFSFYWYWMVVYMLFMAFRILLLFLLWRLAKGISGGGFMQPLSTSQPESS